MPSMFPSPNFSGGVTEGIGVETASPPGFSQVNPPPNAYPQVSFPSLPMGGSLSPLTQGGPLGIPSLGGISPFRNNGTTTLTSAFPAGPTLPTNVHSTDLADALVNPLTWVKIVLPAIMDTPETMGMHPKGGSNQQMLTSFMTEGLVFSGAAGWTTPFSDILSSWAAGLLGKGEALLSLGYNVFSQKRSLAAEYLGGALGKSIGEYKSPEGQYAVQRRVMTKLQTIVLWSGSETPVFRFTLVFPSMKPGDDVRVKAKQLLKSVYPIEEPGGVEKYLPLLQAPNYYSPGSQDTSIQQPASKASPMYGTVAVYVGGWFQLLNMVIRTVDVSFSKEITPDGWPLFLSATITLMPAMMWTTRDIDNLFPDNPLALGASVQQAQSEDALAYPFPGGF